MSAASADDPFGLRTFGPDEAAAALDRQADVVDHGAHHRRSGLLAHDLERLEHRDTGFEERRKLA